MGKIKQFMMEHEEEIEALRAKGFSDDYILRCLVNLKVDRRSTVRFLEYAKALEDVEDEIENTDIYDWRHNLCKVCPAHDFCETKSTGYFQTYCGPYLKGKVYET